MKTKLILFTIVSAMAFSAQAKMSCKILMNRFDEQGKKTVYDLDEADKAKYKKCLDDMKLLPNSFTRFEERTEEEAKKRKEEYNRQQQVIVDTAKQEEVRKTREIYTFTADQIEQMFNKPVFAYRLARRDKFTDGLEHSHHALQKLTDLDKLCKFIGEENDIKGMKAVSAKLDIEESTWEHKLKESGIYIPDFAWIWQNDYKDFETSKKKRDEMRAKGASKLRVLEFSEVTCVRNENKKDEFEDIVPEVTLHTKTKEFSGKAEEDYITISDSLEKKENEGKDEEVSASQGSPRKYEPKGSVQDEVNEILDLYSSGALDNKSGHAVR